MVPQLFACDFLWFPSYCFVICNGFPSMLCTRCSLKCQSGANRDNIVYLTANLEYTATSLLIDLSGALSCPFLPALPGRSCPALFFLSCPARSFPPCWKSGSKPDFRGSSAEASRKPRVRISSSPPFSANLF